ncbi:hypothetical protein GCM10027589_55150 [Actinocorallia lasiicapitis]
MQDAPLEAVRAWPGDPPRDPKGWLITASWRKFLDVSRAATSRRHREERLETEPAPEPGEGTDSLRLYILRARPSLTPASPCAPSAG